MNEDIIRLVVNQYIDKKVKILRKGEKFTERFNLGIMAENIEIELIDKRSHIFKISNELTVNKLTADCLEILKQEVKKRGI